METTTELKQLLKSLRLSSLLTTLPERVAFAKGNKLTHLEFLEMLFSDEVEKRNQGALTRRLLLAKAGEPGHAEVYERNRDEQDQRHGNRRFSKLISIAGKDRTQDA